LIFGDSFKYPYQVNKDTEISTENKQPWGAVAALIVGFGAYLISQIAIALAILPIIRSRGEAATESLNAPWASLVLTAISSAIMLGVVWLFLRSKKFKIRDLGFKKPSLGSIGIAILAYIAYFVVFLVTVLALSAFVPSFNADEAQDVGFVGAQGWQLALAFVGLVIIAPISEEIFFRGFLYRGLRRSWPIWFAALGASVLFALAHGQWNVGVDVFILSLFLIFVFQKTGNLWLTIAMHATKNLIAFLFLFVFISK
jgi:membrane protease YdiL (CAAX protease family)